MAAADEEERRRLRRLAETAGSLAPPQMQRTIEREAPPKPRPWKAASRSERVAVVLVCVALAASLGALGALMTTRGHGLVVAGFIVSLVGVMVYAKRDARRHRDGRH